MAPPPLLHSSPARRRKLRRARLWIGLFMAGLVLSGLTAFPLESELEFMMRLSNHFDIVPDTVSTWIQTVWEGVSDTNTRYPFMAYGTDWLGFGHLMFAVAFIGAYIDPIRNRWILQFGFIACACVIPFALLAGQVREIPIYWRLVDCSFGVVGALVLRPAWKIVLDSSGQRGKSYSTWKPPTAPSARSNPHPPSATAAPRRPSTAQKARPACHPKRTAARAHPDRSPASPATPTENS